MNGIRGFGVRTRLVSHRLRAVIRRMRRVRIGIALETASVTAVEVRTTLFGPRPGRVFTRELQPRADPGSWPDLADALRDLRDALGGRDAVLDVAILRPLCHLKTLSLPRLGATELRQLVTHNASRFLVGSGAPMLADAVRLPSGPQGKALAVAAERDLIGAVFAAAEDAGFTIETVSSGQLAAAVGARVLEPRVRRGSTALALVTPDVIEVLFLRAGRLRGARSVPRTPFPEADGGDEPGESGGTLLSRIRTILEESAESPGCRPERMILLGVEEGDDPSVPPRDEVNVPRIEQRSRLRSLSPAALAAFGATTLPAHTPLLVPETHRDAVRRRDRRRTAGLAAATAVLLLLAGGAHLVDLRRELAAVEQRRAEIRPAVEETLQARSVIQGVDARVAAFRTLERTQPRWNSVFVGLARALPGDAYLLSFHSRSGEIRLDGRARSAASVVSALEASPHLRNVQLTAPIQREQTETGTSERLSVVSTLEQVPRSAPEAPSRTTLGAPVMQRDTPDRLTFGGAH